MIDRDEQRVLQKSVPVWLQRLVWNMSEESADVLTLNYDLLLERAAMSLRRTSGFSDLYVAPLTQRMKPGSGIMISRSEAPGPRISLHKLHGSTNWYGGPPGSDSVPVCVVRDSGLWRPDESRFVPPARYADLQPMIIPPVAVKTLFYNSQALRAGWIRAAQALQTTRHLTIIGYSLPITDNSMAALVTMSLHPAAGVTVVDRSADTVKRITDLLPAHRVVSYVGPTAVADYVGESCPQHVEWGVDTLEDGSQRPNVRVNRPRFSAVPIRGAALG